MQYAEVTDAASGVAALAGTLAGHVAALRGGAGVLVSADGAQQLALAADTERAVHELYVATRDTSRLAALLGASPRQLAAVDNALAREGGWPAAGVARWFAGLPLRGAELTATLTAEAALSLTPPGLLGLAVAVGAEVPDGPGAARATGPPVERAATPTTPAGWMTSVLDAQRVPGQIAVTRLSDQRWVVALPGIHSLGETDDPQDLPGALAAFSTRHGAYARAVVLALGAAGVPAGADLLLVGHSQGGIVAADLAGDPAVRRRWNVTHVLAVGSPIAGVAVPGSTRLLALDNVDDIVPALDLRRHGRPTDRVTVRFFEEHGSVGSNHSLAGVYVPYARSPAFSARPGVADWEASAAAYFTGGPATVTVFALRDG